MVRKEWFVLPRKAFKRVNLALQSSKQVLEVPIFFNAVSTKGCNYEVERVISQVIWKWRHRNGTKSFGGRAFEGPYCLFHCKLQIPVCPFGTALIWSFDNGSITRLQIKATGHKIWNGTLPFFSFIWCVLPPPSPLYATSSTVLIFPFHCFWKPMAHFICFDVWVFAPI